MTIASGGKASRRTRKMQVCCFSDAVRFSAIRSLRLITVSAAPPTGAPSPNAASNASTAGAASATIATVAG